MDNISNLAAQFAGPFILLIIVYLVLIMPRRRKLKNHRNMIEGLRPNDQVITTGGISGRLVGRNKGMFLLEVAPNVRCEVEASKIESVVARGQSQAPGQTGAAKREAGSPDGKVPPRNASGSARPATPPGGPERRPSSGPRKCACGALIEPGDRFCGECGKEIGWQKQP